MMRGKLKRLNWIKEADIILLEWYLITVKGKVTFFSEVINSWFEKTRNKENPNFNFSLFFIDSLPTTAPGMLIYS